MNRITDFTTSDEEALVSRLLVQVHKEIDARFPQAKQAPRQFSKTLFSDTSSEQTAVVGLPTPEEIQQAERRGDENQRQAPGPLPETAGASKGRTQPTARPPTSTPLPRRMVYWSLFLAFLVGVFFALVYFTA